MPGYPKKQAHPGEIEEKVKDGINKPLLAGFPQPVEEIGSDVLSPIQGIGSYQHEVASVKHVGDVKSPSRGLEKLTNKYLPYQDPG
jgi:hypothetical protein